MASKNSHEVGQNVSVGIQGLTVLGVESAATGDSWQDWITGTQRCDVWVTLAWYDVLLRYRRSMLGPLWLTLSMGALIVGMGPLYATLFNTKLTDFFPHLTLGIILWNFLSGVLTEGCFVFISAAGYLKQSPYSRSLFVWRLLTRHFIFLLHHIVLFIPVAVWAKIEMSAGMFAVIPAIGLVLCNLHALVLLLGFLSARFRDVPQIVASVLQLLMFVTPVFWLPNSLPDRSRFILYNPLAAVLEIVRAPLLGKLVGLETWAMATGFTAATIVSAAVAYVLCRKRIIYWV